MLVALQIISLLHYQKINIAKTGNLSITKINLYRAMISRDMSSARILDMPDNFSFCFTLIPSFCFYAVEDCISSTFLSLH